MKYTLETLPQEHGKIYKYKSNNHQYLKSSSGICFVKANRDLKTSGLVLHFYWFFTNNTSLVDFTLTDKQVQEEIKFNKLSIEFESI